MSKPFNEREPITHNIGSIDGLRDAVSSIGSRFTAKRGGKVLCKIDDDWLEDQRRTPVYVEDNQTGDTDSPLRVSAAANATNNQYYQIIQFEEPLNPLVEAIEQSEAITDVSGSIELGCDRQRLSANLDFEGPRFVDPTQSPVTLGIRLDTGHTGFAAVRFEVGAERVVCSNGMTAWDSDFSFTHQHNDGPFRPSVVFNAIDSIGGTGAERTQSRFDAAHEQRLDSKDQMFLLLLEAGIEWLFDDPFSALQEAFENELELHANPGAMEAQPTLYDAYCVGAHAIDHLAKPNMRNPQRAQNAARRGLSTLLEDPVEQEVPDATKLVADTVTSRQDELVNGDTPIVEQEKDILQTVAAEL